MKRQGHQVSHRMVAEPEHLDRAVQYQNHVPVVECPDIAGFTLDQFPTARAPITACWIDLIPVQEIDEVVVNLIGATTTRTGLRVQSQLDTNRYPAGRTVSDDELEAIYLRRDSFHGEWNYSLLPRVALLN